MTDRKQPPDDAAGQSDSTVMLRLDDVPVAQAPSTEHSTEDFPTPQADATVLGMQMPADDEFVPPEEPQPATQAAMSTASRGAVLRRSPPVPAAPEPSPFAPVPSHAVATQEMGTFDEEAPAGSADATLPPINRRGPPAPAAAPPQAKRATGMRAAIPEPAPAPPQAKRATGMRAAIPEPVADPEAASSTVMFNTVNLPDTSSPVAAENANSTVLFSAVAGPPAAPARGRKNLEIDDADTAAKGLAGNDRPTAAKRPLADLVDGPNEDPSTQPGAKDDPHNTSLGIQQRTINGMQLLTAGLLLLIGGATAAHFVSGKVHKPSTAELELIYPFGEQGKKLPNGRVVPPAKDVLFQYQKSEDCDGYRCLTYRLSDKDGRFNYEMVVRGNDENSTWVVVSSKPTGLDQ